MGKKGIVTSILSKLVDTSPASSPNGGGGHQSSPPWPWPSCRNNPQTTSFRVANDDDEEQPCCTSRTTAGLAGGATTTTTMKTTAGRLQLRGVAASEMYKTVNSVYFDPAAADDEFSFLDGCGGEIEEEEVADDGESCFSTTTASEEWSEAVIRSLSRSTSTHRFFFDPGPPSMNSVLPAPAPTSPPASSTTTTAPPTKMPPPEPKKPGAAEASLEGPELDLVVDGDGTSEKNKEPRPCAERKSSSLAEGSVAVAVDSSDPFGDFRASMEEMVAAHGLRDWPALEELLSWYLRVNGKHNHPLIVGAFVDMLIGLASSSSTTTTTTTTTSGGGGGKSSTTTSATSSTSTGTAASMAQCGGGANEACCSSSSSSCATPDDSREEKASGDPSSDDDHIRHECGHQCSTA